MGTLFIIVMAIASLAVLSVMGISLAVGLMIVLAIAAVVTFINALFSWPVILAIVVAWLIFRNKGDKHKCYHRAKYYR
jgi:hypothetical protein